MSSACQMSWVRPVRQALQHTTSTAALRQGYYNCFPLIETNHICTLCLLLLLKPVFDIAGNFIIQLELIECLDILLVWMSTRRVQHDLHVMNIFRYTFCAAEDGNHEHLSGNPPTCICLSFKKTWPNCAILSFSHNNMTISIWIYV